ncbi:MAG: hypothetical protein IPL78_21290 [Chloroflexi bacterium]|nr:hypothetical protein [Chloroflexota bacterium]
MKIPFYAQLFAAAIRLAQIPTPPPLGDHPNELRHQMHGPHQERIALQSTSYQTKYTPLVLRPQPGQSGRRRTHGQQ